MTLTRGSRRVGGRAEHSSARGETVAQFSKLLAYLPRRRFRSFAFLLVLASLQGVFDLLAIALVSRLLGAMVGSRLVDQLPMVRVFGGDQLDQTLWLVGLLLAVSWIGGGLRVVTKVLRSRLSTRIWLDLSQRIYANLLVQPFEFHQTVSRSRLFSMTQLSIPRVADQVIGPAVAIVSACLTTLIVSAGVLIVARAQALLVIAVLIFCFWLMSTLVTPYLRLAASQKIRYEERTSSLLKQSLHSISDIQIYGVERNFIRRFELLGSQAKHFDWIARALPDLPRYVIEPIGITVILAICILPALVKGNSVDLVNSLPVVASILVAALKLTPPLQEAFKSLNLLRGGLPDIAAVTEMLELPLEPRSEDPYGTVSPEGLMPRHVLQLHQVSFRYHGQESWALRDVSLSIPIGSRVAFVGHTGSGKTTTANLLLGLLNPQQGALLLDGIPIAPHELKAWQANCAFVPQSIYLLDGSVRENVAFGIDEDQIDDAAVWEALAAAQLDDVVADLPYGLLTPVGDNGLKLSGGQRQRLALARAFYRKARILVLDEATSALDNQTEQDVIKALQLIGRRCTTIVIAHRLSTIRNCDRIVEFKAGRIVEQGTFEQLYDQSESFRTLAQLEPEAI